MVTKKSGYKVDGCYYTTDDLDEADFYACDICGEGYGTQEEAEECEKDCKDDEA